MCVRVCRRSAEGYPVIQHLRARQSVGAWDRFQRKPEVLSNQVETLMETQVVYSKSYKPLITMLNILNNEDISVLDRQIEQLIDFKPVPEHEVKLLCEKVCSS